MKSISGTKKWKSSAVVDDKPVFILAEDKGHAAAYLFEALVGKGILPTPEMLKLEQVEFQEPKY